MSLPPGSLEEKYDRYAEEIETWLGIRIREGDYTDPEEEIRNIIEELRTKLWIAQEDPELPTMRVGMMSIQRSLDTGEPTHITLILEKGLSHNYEPPEVLPGRYNVRVSVQEAVNRWKTIGKRKDASLSSHYKKHKSKNRSNPRFNKLGKHLSKKLPVDE